MYTHGDGLDGSLLVEVDLVMVEVCDCPFKPTP
jgi:hypothetical protein